jgi:hypothetical protein
MVTTLTNGLLTYYKFDEGSGSTAEDVVSGHDFTSLPTGSTGASGVINEAYNLDVSDYVSLPATVVNGLTDFSFSFWGKINELNTSGTYPNNNIISCANSGENNELYFGYRKNNSRWGIALNGTVYYFLADTTIEDGEWHHIVVTRNGSTAHLYIDGSEVGTGITGNSGTISVSTNGFVIGQDQDSVGGSFATNQAWKGGVDELGIWSRAVTQSEVTQLYNSGSGLSYSSYDAGLLTDINAYYAFDGNADDSHGSNDGTTHIGVLWTSDGKINSGLDYDDYNGIIQTNNFTKPSLPLTISYWVYVPTGTLSDYVILTRLGGRNVTNPYYGIITEVRNEKKPGLIIYDGGGSAYHNNRRSYHSTEVLTDGWHHLTFIVEGTGTSDNKLYIDGVEDTTFGYVSGTGGSLGYYNTGWVIGQTWSSTTYNSCGRIDELALWNRELTSSEVTQLYNGGSGIQYPFIFSPYKIYNGSAWVSTNIKIYNGSEWVTINSYQIGN